MATFCKSAFLPTLPEGIDHSLQCCNVCQGVTLGHHEKPEDVPDVGALEYLIIFIILYTNIYI